MRHEPKRYQIVDELEKRVSSDDRYYCRRKLICSAVSLLIDNELEMICFTKKFILPDFDLLLHTYKANKLHADS
jgi:hypothetical protein